MLRTYRGLLDEIERRNYDVFAGRVRLSGWRKAALVIKALPVRFGGTVNKTHPLQPVGFAPRGLIIRGRFGAAPLPAPLHLARAFARAHYLTAAEKVRIAYGLLCLRLTDPATDPPFLPWLERHGQTSATIDRFWGLVLVSSLNETVDRI